jgi:large subunit ribosomal protein L32e
MEISKALQQRKEKKKRARFLRSDWHKRLRIGRRRKKLRKWRKPKGRHNKIRERRKGRGARVDVGYGSPKVVKGTINGLKPILIYSPKDLEKLREEEIGVIASVGMKKRLEILNAAREIAKTRPIKLSVNAEKELEKIIKEVEEKRQARKQYEEKIGIKAKKEEEKKREEEKEREREKEAKAKEAEKEKEELKKPVELKPQVEIREKEKQTKLRRMALKK